MGDWKEYVRQNYVPGKYGTTRLAKDTGVSRIAIRTFLYKEGIIEEPERDAPIHKPAAQKPAQPQTDASATILAMLKKGATIEALASKVGASMNVASAHIADLQEQGYRVEERDDFYRLAKLIDSTIDAKLDRPWNGERVLRFGLCGDNQDNSKYTQITHLHAFYDILKSEGITESYHTGDIDDGEQMRPGHQYECYSQGADDHVRNIVKNYPARTGITTHFITGNHDHSIIKRVGFDIGPQIASKRPDMIYLGASSAVVNLTPNCTLELRHPIDGTAYALSYKLQKMIEAMSGGEKPSILAVGHYHKADYMLYRNVHAIQTGCFQAQTPWMKGKGIAAMMGGWIIEVHVNDDGEITRFKPEFIPFYKAIKDDYLNW